MEPRKIIVVGIDFKKINKPSESILKYHIKLYERNQNKFIRRSKLEVSHLNSLFEHNDKLLRLIGSIDGDRMLAVDEKEDIYYMIHSDIPTAYILNM
jgi:hypothetical protein